MSRPVPAALAATLICLALAGPASAAPISLGTGSHPDVAVDEGGTAHVVWNVRVIGGDDEVVYCQMPRTAKSCVNEKKFNPPLEAIGRDTYVFVRPGGRVLIYAYRCCGDGQGNYVFESTDGGLNFGPGRAIGKLDPGEQAVFGPGESITASARSAVQNAPLAGPQATGFAELEPGFSIPTYGSVGLHNGTTPVQVRADGENTTFHVYDGSGDINDRANWVGPTAIPAGNEVRLVSGSRGLVLLYRRGSGNKRYWGARTFDGTSFGAETIVTEKGDPIFAAVGSSPSGYGYHAVWIDNRTPNELRWSRSPDAVNWNTPFVSIRGKEPDNMYNLRTSGANDGRAFAVWDQNSGSGTVKGILLPEKGEPPTDRARAGQYSFALYSPFTCVPKGTAVTLTVSTKSKKGVAARKRVALQRAVFRLGDLESTDKKTAYSASFATDDLVAGQTYKVSATIVYRTASGKSKEAGMTGVVPICP